MHWTNSSRKKLWILFFVITGVMILSLVIPGINKTSPSSRVTAETKIKLPAPLYDSTTSLEKALKQRRSIRQYKEDAITLQQVSQLLWAAQ